MTYVIGIDCGGTFTDCVVIRESGELVRDKAFTTLPDLSTGIREAITNAASGWGLAVEDVLRDADVLAIGTTSVTNRLVSRRGAKIGLITTKGHEDAIVIGRVSAKSVGLEPSLKGNITAWRKPDPLVPRSLIRGLNERVDRSGSIVVNLDLDELGAVVADFESQGVEAVAVCLLWSFVNDTHERAIKTFINDRYPHMFVTISSEIAPVIGEYERSLTTALNAYLGPASVDDLEALRAGFTGLSATAPIFVMQSNGGMTGVEAAQQSPIGLLASGPVGGVIGAAALGSEMSAPNLITADMGGTSFDVGLVVDCEPPFVSSTIYDRYPASLPTVAVTSIGSGGGSLAAVDPVTGTLSVGPQSAGSRPGPVCYGHGGIHPTVTDANLVLGRLNAEGFFAGRRTLDLEAAREAIDTHIARPLGISILEAAEGIITIVNGQMADLVRSATLERGFDPREFALMAYGGAAPAHIGALAAELGIGVAIVPRAASVFSAFGVARSDVRVFRSRSMPLRAPFEPDLLRDTFDELTRTCEHDLACSEVGNGRQVDIARFADMRFTNQFHTLSVPVTESLDAESDVELLIKRFMSMYEDRYGSETAFRPAGVEILTFRVRAGVRLGATSLRAAQRQSGGAPKSSVRPVCFDGELVPTTVVWRDSLSPGDVVQGPAVVEEPTTSTLVGKAQRARIDAFENIILEAGE